MKNLIIFNNINSLKEADIKSFLSKYDYIINNNYFYIYSNDLLKEYKSFNTNIYHFIKNFKFIVKNVIIFNEDFNLDLIEFNYLINKDYESKIIFLFQKTKKAYNNPINCINDNNYLLILSGKNYYLNFNIKKIKCNNCLFIKNQLHIKDNYNDIVKPIINDKKISINKKINKIASVVILNEELTEFNRKSLINFFKKINNDIFIIKTYDNDFKLKKYNYKLINFSDYIFTNVNKYIYNNDLFYTYFKNLGYDWIFFYDLNSWIYKNNLNIFTNLGYDIYGAPNEALFNKKLSSKIFTKTSLINIDKIINLLSTLSDEEKTKDLSENINNLNIPSKNILYKFCSKDWVEEYSLLTKTKLSYICYNPINYKTLNDIKTNYNNIFNNYFQNYYKINKFEEWNYNINLNHIFNKRDEKKLYNENKNNYDYTLNNFILKATFPDLDKLKKISEEAKRQNKIPKIIHFCFCSYNNLPEKIKICIKSWIENFRGYYFVNWTPEILDIDNIDFLKKCLNNHMFAFFADYVRVWAVYNFGGFYMDSDIFAYKNFNSLLDLDYVFDKEISDKISNRIEWGCFGAKSNNFLLKKMLLFYENEIRYPQDNNFWENNYKYKNYIMPDLSNSLFNDLNIKIIYNISNIKKYKKLIKSKNKFYVLNSKYLSSPKMQNYNCPKEKYTFTSHCFTNSYC